MKKATLKIDAEIVQLQRRREALAADVTKAKRELDDARKELVSGKSDAQQVTAAQATFTALSEALAAVDEQLSALRAELKEAQIDEQHAATDARRAELQAERTKFQSEFDALREEVDAVLAEKATRMVQLRQRDLAVAKEIHDLSSAPSSLAVWLDRGLIEKPLQFAEALIVATRTVVREGERLQIKAALGRASELQR